MDTLAVFRSRSDALKVYRALLQMKIACTTVSTPTSLHLGCGLSVVFPLYMRDKVAYVINGERVMSFAGFYPR